MSVTDDNGTPGDTGDDFNPAPVLDNGFNIGDTNQDGLLDPNEIWLYDSQTMTITRITAASDIGRDSLAPSISADGRKIVFQSKRSGSTQIYVADTVGGEVRQLTSEGQNFAPAWSGYPQ